MTTVKIELRTTPKRNDDIYPIRIIVFSVNDKKYFPITLKLSIDDWDDKNHRVKAKSKNPDKNLINYLIKSKEATIKLKQFYIERRDRLKVHAAKKNINKLKLYLEAQKQKTI